MADYRKLMYEKAIDGYQFQVNRYNTWMNYYALFVGALLVALYSVWPSENCLSCITETTAVSSSGNWYLVVIISILGWLVSFCWYGALLGYRKWNTHWINVIKDMESKLTDNKLKVYCKNPKQGGLISTQKITGLFIIGAMVAWNAIFALVVRHLCICGPTCCYLFGIIFCAGVGVSAASVIGLHYSACKLICSQVDSAEQP